MQSFLGGYNQNRWASNIAPKQSSKQTPKKQGNGIKFNTI
jgi:hypothetical protein